MKKGIIALAAVVVIAGVIVGLIFSPSEKTARTQVFHARLADPDMYRNGVFSDTFEIRNGTYQFLFVPNGDSPKILSISLKGQAFSFSEDFVLEGTPHETGISKYYTWEYLGVDTIQVPEGQTVEIVIDPHGEVMGPVSVYLVE